MTQIYCGNNKNYHGLISGTHILGTNYECLKKGIGVGFNLPFDPLYLNNFIPIDKRKFYCGKNITPPIEYFAIGNASICLQKGVGTGKRLKALKGSKSKSRGRSRTRKNGSPKRRISHSRKSSSKKKIK